MVKKRKRNIKGGLESKLVWKAGLGFGCVDTGLIFPALVDEATRIFH